MITYPHTFTATLPITQDRDGDDQLPTLVSRILRASEERSGAHYFGNGSPREVLFLFENENDLENCKRKIMRIASSVS